MCCVSEAYLLQGAEQTPQRRCPARHRPAGPPRHHPSPLLHPLSPFSQTPATPSLSCTALAYDLLALSSCALPLSSPSLTSPSLKSPLRRSILFEHQRSLSRQPFLENCLPPPLSRRISIGHASFHPKATCLHDQFFPAGLFSVMFVEQLHVSVGCNRVVGALDWGPTGLIAYGGHNSVVIYDPEVLGVP